MAPQMQNDTPSIPTLKRPALNPYALIALVIALALIGGALVLRFSNVQEQREMMQWQNKLNIIADSRASDIEAWLDRHFKELGNVAANPSLQLYMSTILSGSEPQKVAGEESAQIVFLRNLLSITADRMGFIEKPSEELKSINADVQKPSGVGLAIINNDGKILVSTAGLSTFDTDLTQKLSAAPKDQASLIDLYTSPTGKTRIGFVLPIYPIEEGVSTGAPPIGSLVGIKDIDENFFGLLRQPGVIEKTLEAVLLRKQNGNVAYLTAVQDPKLGASEFALDTPDLDAAYAVTVPGSFAVKLDRTSHATLMTSRVIARSPWIMMVHIDRDHAMADSNTWRQQTECIMFFALLAVIGGIVAVWYYGTSRRVYLLSLETTRLALRLGRRERMLSVVSDNQPEPILIVDRANIAHFANEKAAQSFHTLPVDIIGKDLAALMGPLRAKEYSVANDTALTKNETITRTWRTETAQVFRSQHIPLPHVPVDSLTSPSPGVLIIDQDVTEVVNERERRLRTLQQLIGVLLSMVDSRDPYAANHSLRVGAIAREVANGMDLGDQLAETAEEAGKLMNIGKLSVPHEVLTKTTALNDSEMKLIRESLQDGVTFLRKIDFDGPVVETLNQMQERFNGTGPLGLKKENILVTARIIAVTNAFIGMVSPRSYHAAMSTENAIKILLQDMDEQFDSRVVVALAHFIENKRGKETLARMALGA